MFLAIFIIYVANIGIIFDTSKYFASYFFLLFVNGDVQHVIYIRKHCEGTGSCVYILLNSVELSKLAARFE